MNQCKTCKHWVKTDNEEGLDFGECKAPVKYWNSDKTFADGSKNAGGDHIAQKGNTHMGLSTSSEFACVQHENDMKLYVICECWGYANAQKIMGIFDNIDAAETALAKLADFYEIREYYLNKEIEP